MPYLMEVTGRHRVTKAERVFRFTDLAGGYSTAPGDTPANAQYRSRIEQPGNYRRNLFGSGGRTNGFAEVDRGVIKLVNNDGKLDDMRLYAFDGYDLAVSMIAGAKARFRDRIPLLRGTMEQMEPGWDGISLSLRSRLALLDQPLQTATYGGTTTDGTKAEAEGGEDLKGVPRLVLYGAPLNVPAVLLNRFWQIYGVGHKLAAVLKVRARGAVLDAAGADYPTAAALKAATIPDAKFATCLAEGLIRIGGNALRNDQVTVDAVEKATAAERTAAQVARRLLTERGGLVEGIDFLAGDIAALDALAPYEVGYWPGTGRVTTLAAVSAVLDSVGASIAPDRLGVFRIVRFGEASGPPVRTFDRFDLLDEDGVGFQRLATGDDGKGVPAKNIAVEHSRNHAVVTRDNLASTVTTSDAAFADFAVQEWRQEDEPAPDIAEIHKLAPEMVFQTLLVKAANAKAEAIRRKGLYSTYRDRYAIKVRPDRAAAVDLGSVVGLKVNRFGLDVGRSFVVTGMLENLEENVTTLDLWG